MELHMNYLTVGDTIKKKFSSTSSPAKIPLLNYQLKASWLTTFPHSLLFLGLYSWRQLVCSRAAAAELSVGML
jgi:hypothetical protein